MRSWASVPRARPRGARDGVRAGARERPASAGARRAAGSTFATAGRWRSSTGRVEGEREACRATVGIGDVSWLGKLELQGEAADVAAVAAGGADGIDSAGPWGRAWCCVLGAAGARGLEPSRAPELRDALIAAARPAMSVTDMTCALAALALVGPLARDVLARLTAIDLRPDHAPQASFRPGSVARIPGMVLRERGERYVLMF